MTIGKTKFVIGHYLLNKISSCAISRFGVFEMITSLTLALTLSCSISVAEQLRTDPLHVDFTVQGLKSSVCTSEQLETEYLMWLYAQQEKQREQRNSSSNRKEK